MLTVIFGLFPFKNLTCAMRLVEPVKFLNDRAFWNRTVRHDCYWSDPNLSYSLFCAHNFCEFCSA